MRRHWRSQGRRASSSRTPCARFWTLTTTPWWVSPAPRTRSRRWRPGAWFPGTTAAWLTSRTWGGSTAVSDSLNWGGRDFSPYALGAPVPVVKFEPLDFDSKTVGRLIDNAKWHGLKEQRAMEKTHIVRNSGYTREALAPD